MLRLLFHPRTEWTAQRIGRLWFDKGKTGVRLMASGLVCRARIRVREARASGNERSATEGAVARQGAGRENNKAGDRFLPPSERRPPAGFFKLLPRDLDQSLRLLDRLLGPEFLGLAGSLRCRLGSFLGHGLSPRWNCPGGRRCMDEQAACQCRRLRSIAQALYFQCAVTCVAMGALQKPTVKKVNL